MLTRQDCILVIEDDKDQAVLISEAFKRSTPNISIATAEDSTSALAYLSDMENNDAYFPRLILLDLYLPRLQDGLNLLMSMQEVLRRASTGAIPIVVLTHSRNEKDVLTCYQLGANAYMVKPDTFQGWEQLGDALYNYWFKTATLPKRSY